MSQVVVRDKRTHKRAGVRYRELANGDLFNRSIWGESVVMLKLESKMGGEAIIQIAGTCATSQLPCADLPDNAVTWSDCIPRPDLKLTLLLENA